MKTSLIFIIIAMLITQASAQTDVSGDIEGNWNLGGSPYIIGNHTTVLTGTTLEIQEGATQFHTSCSGTPLRMN